MDGYAPVPVGLNGGYPDSDYTQPDYPDDGFPTLPNGSAPSFIREKETNEGTPPTPLFPGNSVHGFPRNVWGNINQMLETDNGFSENIMGHAQDVYKQVPDGINAKDVDHWAMHPGDVNLDVGYWDAMTGTPRDQAPRGGDLVAAGPNTGFAVQYSGYVAQGRIPTAGQPGPVSGRIGADYLQSVQASNAEVLYATQLSDAAINNAVFTG